MVCRHSRGDPNCSSHPSYVADTTREREATKRNIDIEVEKRLAAMSPDSSNYEVLDVVRYGPHIVMKVQYPNCAKCSYEGSKVMVFLNVKEADVMRWRVIDPHFRDPKKATSQKEAPSPAARFPGSDDGWRDAIAYAQGKTVK